MNTNATAFYTSLAESLQDAKIAADEVSFDCDRCDTRTFRDYISMSNAQLADAFLNSAFNAALLGDSHQTSTVAPSCTTSTKPESGYSFTPPIVQKAKAAPKKTPKKATVYGLFEGRKSLPFYIGNCTGSLSVRLVNHRNGQRPTQKFIRDLESKGVIVSIQELAVIRGNKYDHAAAEYNIAQYYLSRGAKLINTMSKFPRLSMTQVRDIRLLVKNGISQKSLAKNYGVSRLIIHDVVAGNTYRE